MGRYAGTAGTGFLSATQSAAAASETDWLRDAWALLRKDVRAELRTKTALSSVGIFAFASLLLMGLATATLKETPGYNMLTQEEFPAWTDPSKLGLLWT